MSYDLVSLGEILIDFKVDQKNNYIKNPGGAPLNVCAVLSKYNCKTAFIGKVGDDEDGKFLKETLDKLQIDSSNLVFDPLHQTTQAFITTDNKGERYFSFKRENTADLFLSKEDIDLEKIKKAKIFHFGSLSLVTKQYEDTTKYALEKAKESGCIISFDPNYREDLWKNKQLAIKKITSCLPYIDILKVSTEELQLITKTKNTINAIEALAKHKIPIILVTDGANGAMFKYKNFIGNAKTIKVNPIDTTGAGDIFLGTFLTKIIKNFKPISQYTYEELLSFLNTACTQASLSTEKYGAIPSIPDLN